MARRWRPDICLTNLLMPADSRSVPLPALKNAVAAPVAHTSLHLQSNRGRLSAVLALTFTAVRVEHPPSTQMIDPPLGQPSYCAGVAIPGMSGAL